MPYWCATPQAVRAGYPLKTARLSGYAPEDIPAACQRLQTEMLDWLADRERDELEPNFDGTIASLLTIYQVHPESSYRRLKSSSVQPYTVYAKMLIEHVGENRVEDVTGLEIQRWYGAWRGPHDRLARAAMALSVLKAALSFGALCGLPHCAALHATTRLLRLPGPRPRTQAPTAPDVIAARRAAHELRRPRAALAFALQFEATLRVWDVIGQWVPLDDPRPSAVLGGVRKWVGLTWGQIGPDLILTITPSKTERSTGARVTIDLREMPMVMEELAMIPLEARVGPLIVCERDGQPYTAGSWPDLWARVRKRAGLSADLWSRDLRAGGVTEGGAAGASADDRAKVAGHSKSKITADVYDRQTVEAHRRTARARKQFREKPE